MQVVHLRQVNRVLLNLDGGEYDSEPAELYRLADVVHIACGGHAGDATSMARVVEACLAHGTRIGAHPSYVDREGFGRRAMTVAPELLADQIAEQCSALRKVAEAHGTSVRSAKPHGALYHAAHGDEATARATVEGIARALGDVAIVGLAGGAIEAEAKRRGHRYLREAFADRGVRPDGTLVPRGQPGAILEDPQAAAERARVLEADTLCVHADTATALLITRAVRAALDARPAPFGEGVRFGIPEGTSRRALLAALGDAVLTEEFGWVEGAPNLEPLLRRPPGESAARGASHVIRVVYDGEDLDEVARAIGKSRDDVVALHASREYDVAMLGFLPGFAYLRSLPPELRLPRRAPRTRVPPGSVGIAADYTGIYPFASPGGWHLLGRAVDFAPFALDRATLAVGDTVRFEPVAAGTVATPAIVTPLHEPRGPYLEIVRAAGLALLIDGGRPGHKHEGVPPGGPLVRSLFDRANAFAGNARGACAIELSGTLEVVARGNVTIADDDARIELADGERHALSTAGTTRVRYLAIAGGFDAPEFLGSKSALLVAGFGRPLKKSDRLGAGSAAGTTSAPDRALDAPILVMEGPDARGMDTLTKIAYRISPSSDRTGTRLEGPSPPLDLARRSAPMVIGAIEVTPSGPIVLGPDHPTTGGYPVVAVVRSLDAFFSRPIGTTVRFEVG
jgi:UPF0271 protein